VRFLPCSRSEGEEEVEEEGPVAVSPKDFVDNEEVLTLDEFEARKAAEKA
jgi:hypothetical protein